MGDKRILLGKANDGSSDIYGMWVSKANVPVIDPTSGELCNVEDMLFDSRHDYGQTLARGLVDGTGGADTIDVKVRNHIDPFVSWKSYESSGTVISTKGSGEGTAWSWYLNSGNQFDISTSISGNDCTVTITPDSDIQKDIAYIIVQGDT
jgi:hypothetical protein